MGAAAWTNTARRAASPHNLSQSPQRSQPNRSGTASLTPAVTSGPGRSDTRAITITAPTTTGAWRLTHLGYPASLSLVLAATSERKTSCGISAKGTS